MKYLIQPHRFWRNLPTYPLIFLAIIPLAILDLWVEAYHRFCFPLYRIPLVKRRQYIKIDRHKLSYVKGMQKYNCVYCGYANGVVKYWAKIFAETESYWCGIMHKQYQDFHVPEHHATFAEYGNEEDFSEKYMENRTKRF